MADGAAAGPWLRRIEERVNGDGPRRVELNAVLGAAPRLSDMLARQPQIMDGLIDPRFFGALPLRDEISERLAASLADAQSHEDFLDRLCEQLA